MRGLSGILVIAAAVALSAGALSAGAQPADTDGDGIPDAADNCVLIANGPALDVEGLGNPFVGCYVGVIQIDTDGDGWGNPCDGDFNQDGVADFGDIPDFLTVLATGVPIGLGTDMNCDDVTDFVDVPFFTANAAVPGPGP